jgi:hypothetical protein
LSGKQARRGGIYMVGEGGQRGSGDVPRVAARLEVDFLDEAAKRRVEQVVSQVLSEELSNQPRTQSLEDLFGDLEGMEAGLIWWEPFDAEVIE